MYAPWLKWRFEHRLPYIYKYSWTLSFHYVVLKYLGLTSVMIPHNWLESMLVTNKSLKWPTKTER